MCTLKMFNIFQIPNQASLMHQVLDGKHEKSNSNIISRKLMMDGCQYFESWYNKENRQ